MTTRLIVAYSLIALLVLAGAAAVWWNVYHSKGRTEARRSARVNERHRRQDEARLAERERG